MEWPLSRMILLRLAITDLTFWIFLQEAFTDPTSLSWKDVLAKWLSRSLFFLYNSTITYTVVLIIASFPVRYMDCELHESRDHVCFPLVIQHLAQVGTQCLLNV